MRERRNSAARNAAWVSNSKLQSTCSIELEIDPTMSVSLLCPLRHTWQPSNRSRLKVILNYARRPAVLRLVRFGDVGNSSTVLFRLLAEWIRGHRLRTCLYFSDAHRRWAYPAAALLASIPLKARRFGHPAH